MSHQGARAFGISSSSINTSLMPEGGLLKGKIWETKVKRQANLIAPSLQCLYFELFKSCPGNFCINEKQSSHILQLQFCRNNPFMAAAVAARVRIC